MFDAAAVGEGCVQSVCVGACLQFLVGAAAEGGGGVVGLVLAADIYA